MGVMDALVKLLCDPPPENKHYGYLYLTNALNAKLNIYPEFHTFAEVYADLPVYNPEHWTVSKYKIKTDKPFCYIVKGNGFLYEN